MVKSALQRHTFSSNFGGFQRSKGRNSYIHFISTWKPWVTWTCVEMDSNTKNEKMSYSKTFGVLPLWTVSQVTKLPTNYPERKCTNNFRQFSVFSWFSSIHEIPKTFIWNCCFLRHHLSSTFWPSLYPFTMIWCSFPTAKISLSKLVSSKENKWSGTKGKVFVWCETVKKRWRK